MSPDEVDLFITEMTELAEQRRAAEVAQTFWIVFFWVYFACVALSACVTSQKQALFRGIVYGLFLGPFVWEASHPQAERRTPESDCLGSLPRVPTLWSHVLRNHPSRQPRKDAGFLFCAYPISYH